MPETKVLDTVYKSTLSEEKAYCPVDITLFESLRSLRKFHDLTQRQVAEILDLDRSTYAYYEIGKSLPRYETLIRLSRLYSVTADELLSVQ